MEAVARRRIKATNENMKPSDVNSSIMDSFLKSNEKINARKVNGNQIKLKKAISTDSDLNVPDFNPSMPFGFQNALDRNIKEEFTMDTEPKVENDDQFPRNLKRVTERSRVHNNSVQVDEYRK